MLRVVIHLRKSKHKINFKLVIGFYGFVPSKIQKGLKYFCIMKWGLARAQKRTQEARTVQVHIGVYTWIRVNDPAAGSPTATLLRLLLPLNDQV